jgi:hypothetical protein
VLNPVYNEMRRELRLYCCGCYTQVAQKSIRFKSIQQKQAAWLGEPDQVFGVTVAPSLIQAMKTAEEPIHTVIKSLIQIWHFIHLVLITVLNQP